MHVDFPAFKISRKHSVKSRFVLNISCPSVLELPYKIYFPSQRLTELSRDGHLETIHCLMIYLMWIIWKLSNLFI